MKVSNDVWSGLYYSLFHGSDTSMLAALMLGKMPVDSPYQLEIQQQHDFGHSFHWWWNLLQA